MSKHSFKHETKDSFRRITMRLLGVFMTLTTACLFDSTLAQAETKAVQLCGAHINADKGGHRRRLNLKQTPDCQALEKEYESLVDRGLTSCLVAARAESELGRSGDAAIATDRDCDRETDLHQLRTLASHVSQAGGEGATNDAVKTIIAYDAFMAKTREIKYSECAYRDSSESLTATGDHVERIVMELRSELVNNHDRVQTAQEKNQASTRTTASEKAGDSNKGKKEWTLFAKREAKKRGEKDPWREGPWSDMNPILRVGLSMAIGGFLERFKGGGIFPTGHTQLARGLTTLGYTGLGYLNGGYDGAIAGALMLPGMFLGHGSFMTIGRNGERSKWADTAIMSALGVGRTGLSGAYLWARGYGPGFLASGALSGACYSGAYQWAGNLTVGAKQGFIDGPTSLGEICTGMSIGAAMPLTFQYGGR
jgi:hypothetical protein